MGVRRYSRSLDTRRLQEQFDELQRRVGVDYHCPTIGELAEAGIRRARPVCRDYACLHYPLTPMDLTTLPPKMATRTLRKKLVCSRCGLRRPRLELIWEGEES